mmetsp:Transcript_20261/g.20377  ORF Transcript_20261/g.20377 Transcript_20261/m.20377 type:complete len:571 (+) Transcript_20261:3-1715(+)
MQVNCTVHKVLELMCKTDDKTQQAMLRKKTFVLACSEEIPREFTAETVSEADREADSEQYDRFYPEMQGFCQPDVNVGAAPKFIERQYKVVVVQGGEVVDTFLMKKDEVILDIESVYLCTEYDPTTITMINPTSGVAEESKESDKKRIKRKVFVAVSTSMCDVHGEDSQGEGRLLLLALDYALYQNMTDERDKEGMGGNSGDTEYESKIQGTTESSSVSGTMPPPVTTGARRPPASQTMQSLAQTQFLGAIQPKLRLIWSGYGPATVVKQFDEYLVSTVGPTVYLYRLVPELMELEQVSQFYAQFFVTSVSIIKSYLMLADAFKSVQFLAFREADMSLTLVAKDFTDGLCMSAAYIVDGPVLGMVICDDEGNMKLLRYNPGLFESKKGFQLLRIADIHIGSDVSLLLPHRVLGDPTIASSLSTAVTTISNDVNAELMRKQRFLRGTTLPFGARLQKNSMNKSSLVVGTMDGGLGMLVPLEERTYRRLVLLEQVMSTALETTCGLNPREHRNLKSCRVLTNKKRGVLDGNSLFRFVTLEPSTQLELTGAMGTTVDIVMDNLLEIDVSNSFF